MRDGKGRGVGRVRVQDTTNVVVVRVHCGMHGDDRALNWWQLTSRSTPSSPTRTTAEAAWFRSDGPAVNTSPVLREPSDSRCRVRCRNRPARYHPLCDVDHLIDQVLVHATPMSLSWSGYPSSVRSARTSKNPLAREHRGVLLSPQMKSCFP